MSPTRAQTQTTGVEHSNHEATTCSQPGGMLSQVFVETLGGLGLPYKKDRGACYILGVIKVHVQ